MDGLEENTLPASLRSRPSRRPVAAARTRTIESVLLGIGVVVAVVRHGLGDVTSTLALELGVVVMLVPITAAVGNLLRWRWSVEGGRYLRKHAVVLAILALWAAATVTVPAVVDFPANRTAAGDVFRLAEMAVGLLALQRGVELTRRVAAGGRNPGFLLVASFLLLIGIGTILLLLPGARRFDETVPDVERVGAPIRVALFTATSASCVTGLIVEPTGSYWSTFGHVVILVLFQVGGLGIMTCGAFFAAAMGSRLAFRESATLGNLLETESANAIRALLKTILIATLATELVGGLLLMSLWPDEPLLSQIFHGFFHSVSAFCNAGFSLRDDGFLDWGMKWQIGWVATGLIIAGGLGFAVTYNLWLWGWTRLKGAAHDSTPLFHFPGERAKLTLGTKIVLVTTAALLIGGTFVFFLLESLAPSEATFAQRCCDAWFQSVTFRTAGFNTVDLGKLQPSTKLFAMFLMFVGASPGSTGGGIKTATIAIAVLAVVAALRGQDRVDVGHRTIPARQVTRALTIIALGVACLMATALLLVVFEPRGRHDTLDLLFEATSAFATVGVSTGLTGELQPPSQFVLVLAMFLGRVGPLTLLLALAGQQGDIRYKYPEETIALG